MCKCFSAVGVGTVFEHLQRQRARHVEVLQLRPRGPRVRAPLAVACGAMCRCFSYASVGTVSEHL